MVIPGIMLADGPIIGVAIMSDIRGTIGAIIGAIAAGLDIGVMVEPIIMFDMLAGPSATIFAELGSFVVPIIVPPLLTQSGSRHYPSSGNQ